MYYLDKRVVKSREIMVKTLIGLLQKKPINKITIKEICDKSGVARTTFYRNHSTIEDLLTKWLKDWYYKTFDEIFNDKDFDYTTNQRFFKACQKDFDFFKIVYKYNLDGPIMTELQKCIDSFIRKTGKGELSAQSAHFYNNYPYSLYAFTGITHMTIRYWIENESLSVEEINKMFISYHNW